MGLLDLIRGKKDNKTVTEAVPQEMVTAENKSSTRHEGINYPEMPPVNAIRLQNSRGGPPEPPAVAVIPEERKEETASLAYEDKLNADTIRFLSLQELLFLYAVQESVKDSGDAETGVRYEENHRIVRNEVLSRIRKTDKIYCLFDLSTGYPFLERGCALIYLDHDTAVYASGLYAMQNRRLIVRECRGEGEDMDKAPNFFDMMYYLGAAQIIIDNGCYNIIINRNEIVADPGDWSNKQDVMPVNGALVAAMLDFLQEIRWQVGYEQRAQVLKDKEKRMLDRMLKASFIIPTVHEGPAEVLESGLIRPGRDVKLRFPMLQGENGENFLPVYTDMAEFSKRFRGSGWMGGVFDFNAITACIEDKNGFIINPDGERLVMTAERIRELIGSF